ncbi:MAG TPA: hypothetical protein VJ939_01485 [Bacteroidales bacterium]|nr:hypothetical protein [Bacteroidales bacterium]
MKHFKLVALVLTIALLSGCGLNKMIKNYEEVDYTVTPEVLENKGGEVELEVKGFIPEKYFHPKAALEFKPVLKYEGGEKELESFRMKGEKADGEGKIISKKEGGSFTYNTTFEYEDGMQDAVLITNPVASLKDKTAELGKTQLAEGVIITSTRIKHDEKVVAASHMYEKETIISEKANIYFAQNFSNLNWWLDLNKEENTKKDLAAMKDFIRQGWKIKNIELNAWASPEGEISFNEDLAVERAETGKEYLTGQLNQIAEEKDSKVNIESAEDVNLDVYPKGEDWNGFMEAVENSDLEAKSTILNVVRSQPDLKEREEEIRNMSMIYDELAEEILPPLRRVEFTVNSFEPKHSDEELQDLIFSNPDTLDIKEMLYAAAIQKTNEKKIEAYEVINNHHKKCWRAFNNKGAVMLEENMLDEAESSLKKAKELKTTGEVYNNMAVLALKRENFEKGEELLGKAKKAGINTSYNMGIINMIEGDFAKAESNFKAADCNYNLALAQLMNDKADKAVSTLECSEKGAKEHYLLAVIFARKDNQSKSLEHLEVAVEKCSALKANAKIDKEFIDYFDAEEFKSIVK